MNKVTIIGAGIIGLTTALKLREAGFEVEIIAASFPPFTTSNKAGAIWSPFHIEPRKKVIEWSKITFLKLEELAQQVDSGVKMVDFYKKEFPEETEWQQAFPKASWEIIEQTNDFILYQTSVPFVQTSKHLDFLLQECKERGVSLKQQKIESLEHYLSFTDWIVNCTGLGARELCQDKEVYPVQGQIVQVKTQKNVRFWDDNTSKELTYIFPREDCCVLGGTARVNEENTFPEKGITKKILENCQRIEPNLNTDTILNQYVGLRPARKQVRLEKEDEFNIVHNYGHGGAGFSVNWGCAEEVLKLLTIVDK